MPDCPYETIRASGANCFNLAVRFEQRITAAAPSFKPDALPAVTVPAIERNNQVNKNHYLTNLLHMYLL